MPDNSEDKVCSRCGAKEATTLFKPTSTLQLCDECCDDLCVGEEFSERKMEIMYES